MLTLARESRGWKQDDVATAMRELEGEGSKVGQAYVSRAESGRVTVSGERLELYARALDYPVELLTLNETEVGAGPGIVHHRKKQAVVAQDLRRIHAALNLARVQVRRLVDGAPRHAPHALPSIEVDDYTSPEEAARAVRKKWGVERGPLDSVVALLEGAGGLVLRRSLVSPMALDSGAESVPLDAVSGLLPGEDPIVLLNEGTPADRQRFTLAHELGHMVMHQVPNSEQEKQANRFAAELLMPARDIRDDLAGVVDLRALVRLKPRWRVSMWALLRRAHTLNAITDWQYRNLAVEMTTLGYRTTEPLGLDSEQPNAVNQVVRWHLSQGRTPEELACAVLLNPDEFDRLYLGGAGASARRPAETRDLIPFTEVEP
ncbi:MULTISPECIES: ImmA/IrrE family metallo-endopeptidase [Actinosynnema]|uniref:ImmA/IrrE family metallo-endopeptidase n=1 Tax=Actinosynnema TaxID=40566 RepID=UPI0020A2E028|nr:ImmA/IrrE family metallo-endopeptidase [Actinosynnema pretiosum]MCP2099815.1 Zn-dependent peptidase ImmA, M78 family [Actinosynnema pretiosum]